MIVEVILNTTKHIKDVPGQLLNVVDGLHKTCGGGKLPTVDANEF